MDDITNSFKAYLYDRLSSPLLFTFSLSWSLWNHRLFVVLFTSDLKVKEKFAYVDEVLYPTIYEIGLRGLSYPLLSALFLIFVYPIPSRWVFEYVRKEQKKLKGIQQEIEDDTPVTQEEARNLRAIIREAANTLDQAISERDKTIKEQQSEIDRLRTQLAVGAAQGLVTTPPAKKADGGINFPDFSRTALSSKEREMLHMVAQSDGMTEGALRKYFRENYALEPLEVKYLIDRLEAKRLIEVISTGAGQVYRSTPSGRSNLMNVDVTVDESTEE